MGMQPARQHRLLPARDAMRHEHGLARRRRAVVHRSICDFHAGELGDLRLELEEILQRALRDLRLIRRVAREKLRSLNEMIDACRHMVLVSAGADEERQARGGHIACSHAADQVLDLHLALPAGKVRQLRQALVARDVGEEIVDGIDADAGEHVATVGVGEGQVAHQQRLRSSVILRKTAWFRMRSCG